MKPFKFHGSNKGMGILAVGAARIEDLTTLSIPCSQTAQEASVAIHTSGQLEFNSEFLHSVGDIHCCCSLFLRKTFPSTNFSLLMFRDLFKIKIEHSVLPSPLLYRCLDELFDFHTGTLVLHLQIPNFSSLNSVSYQSSAVDYNAVFPRILNIYSWFSALTLHPKIWPWSPIALTLVVVSFLVLSISQ